MSDKTPFLNLFRAGLDTTDIVEFLHDTEGKKVLEAEVYNHLHRERSAERFGVAFVAPRTIRVRRYL